MCTSPPQNGSGNGRPATAAGAVCAHSIGILIQMRTKGQTESTAAPHCVEITGLDGRLILRSFPSARRNARARNSSVCDTLLYGPTADSSPSSASHLFITCEWVAWSFTFTLICRSLPTILQDLWLIQIRWIKCIAKYLHSVIMCVKRCIVRHSRLYTDAFHEIF